MLAMMTLGESEDGSDGSTDVREHYHSHEHHNIKKGKKLKNFTLNNNVYYNNNNIY